MSYYHNATATVDWDDLTGSAIFTRVGFAKGDPYREPNDKIVELLKEKKRKKILADARMAGVSDPEDMEWTAKNWAPRAIAAGLRWMAVVLPSAALVQMQINRAAKTANIGYESRFFDNLDEAKAWLRSVG